MEIQIAAFPDELVAESPCAGKTPGRLRPRDVTNTPTSRGHKDNGGKTPKQFARASLFLEQDPIEEQEDAALGSAQSESTATQLPAWRHLDLDGLVGAPEQPNAVAPATMQAEPAVLATEIEAVRAYVPASEFAGWLDAFEAKVEAEAEAQAKAAAACPGF